MAVIGLDLGGTKLAGALFGAQGQMLWQAQAELAGRRGRAVGGLVRQQARLLLETARAKRLKVTALGASVPGISNSQTGRVWTPNIPGWTRYPLQRELEKAVGDNRIRVVMDSDRACSILGETWRGAARGCRNAIFLAVGTGIGAGLLAEGKLVRGAQGCAGAIGWLGLARPFRPEYAACGCFEHHASGAGLANIAREILARPAPPAPATSEPPSLAAPAPLGPSTSPLADLDPAAITAPAVFAAYRQGDAPAKAVVAQAVEFWGMAVANLVSLFNPERIIFGGGVFGPALQFLEDIAREARKWAQPIAMRRVKLLPAGLGPAAPLYGAARLALDAARKRRA